MTPKQLQKMYSDPEYKAFVKSGSRLKVSKLFTMAYIVATVFTEYVDEAQEIMEKYHMNQKSIKTKANNLTQYFDAYDKVMRSFLNEETAKKLLTEDYEDFKRITDKFMNYEDLKGE